MSKIFIKYRIAIVAAVILVCAGGGYWYIRANVAPSFGSVAVAKGNVIASLDEPATVLTENSASLSFQAGGEIMSLNVSEGDHVSQGEVIAALDTSSLKAAADQADAAVQAAEAQLGELEAGVKPEQISIDQSAVQSANTSLSVALGNAYSSAADAIQNQTDILFDNPSGPNPTFIIPVSDSQLVNEINFGRLQVGSLLSKWYDEAASDGTAQSASVTGGQQTTDATAAGSNASVGQDASDYLNDLQNISSYLNSVALAVNGATPNAVFSSATLAADRAAVAAAKTEVNGAISAVTAAQTALVQANGKLALDQSGATAEDINAQKAAVAEAQAASMSADVNLAHAELIAPFDGTVENLSAKIGEVVTPGEPMLTLVNADGLKIRAYVSEADVAKVNAGDEADITLDAFGSNTEFSATVTSVAAIQTEINGVPSYEVTMHFKKYDSRLKDGMTGNAHIIIGEHDGVILVPSRLIINNGGNYFVLMNRGGKSIEQPVTIGLVGDSGMTEVASGLTLGDQLINF